jgi:hypothetical protein
MGILLRNPNTSEKQGTDPKKNAAINHPLIAASFGSSVLQLADQKGIGSNSRLDWFLLIELCMLLCRLSICHRLSLFSSAL